MRAYFELIKPRVTFAALATVLLGFWIVGGKKDRAEDISMAVVGAFFIGAGANALNQYLESAIDRKMKPTREAEPIRREPSPDAKLFSSTWVDPQKSLEKIQSLYLVVEI